MIAVAVILYYTYIIYTILTVTSRVFYYCIEIHFTTTTDYCSVVKYAIAA